MSECQLQNDCMALRLLNIKYETVFAQNTFFFEFAIFVQRIDRDKYQCCLLLLLLLLFFVSFEFIYITTTMTYLAIYFDMAMYGNERLIRIKCGETDSHADSAYLIAWHSKSSFTWNWYILISAKVVCSSSAVALIYG